MLLYGCIGSSFQNFEGCSSCKVNDFVRKYRTSGFWKGGVRIVVDSVLSPFFETAGLEFQIGEADVTDYKLSANCIMLTIDIGF